MKPSSITTTLIAPCGMNCGICYTRMRDENTCPGCNKKGKDKPGYCERCVIKKCKKLRNGTTRFCFSCDTYPCRRLKQLDKRYRTKYGMSMIKNLHDIRMNGIRSFVNQERKRWTCPGCGHLLCVHRDQCSFCGIKR